MFSEGSGQRRKVLAPRSLEAPSDWAVGEMCGKMNGGFSRRRLFYLSMLYQGKVAFADVAVYFSWEEWCLLDEVQIHLYLSCTPDASASLVRHGCPVRGTLFRRGVQLQIPSGKGLLSALCPVPGRPQKAQ